MISSADPFTTIHKAQCLNASSSVVSADFGINQVYQGVEIAGHDSNLNAVILLMETAFKKSFLVGEIDFGHRKIPKLDKFFFLDSSAFEILSVAKRQPGAEV